MSGTDGKPYVLSAALALLMLVQAGLGLLLQEQYRDVAWVRAGWFANDWVTLVVAVPLPATLHLPALSVSSAVAGSRGLVPAPGEIPAWGTLAGLTAGATGLLFVRGRQPQSGDQSS